jgi:hypothetical protein
VSRWIDEAGRLTAEGLALIERGRAGEPWADIAATFYPNSRYGVRKACDVFSQYADPMARAERKEALIRRNFNRNTGPQNPVNYRAAGFQNMEPPLRRESADPWAGLGMCFR